MADGPAKDSLADAWIKRLKNSPIIAAFIIIAPFLAGAAFFTDSIEKLERFASKIFRKQEGLTPVPPECAFRPESKSSNEVTSSKSIMGGDLCLANHPSDLAPALVALDTNIQIASPRGLRRVSAADFFPGHIWVGSPTHPFRSVDAENFLRAKNIDETLAGQASEVALTNARPLKMNQYKFDLAKTLGKPALLAIAS